MKNFILSALILTTSILAQANTIGHKDFIDAILAGKNDPLTNNQFYLLKKCVARYKIYSSCPDRLRFHLGKTVSQEEKLSVDFGDGKMVRARMKQFNQEENAQIYAGDIPASIFLSPEKRQMIVRFTNNEQVEVESNPSGSTLDVSMKTIQPMSWPSESCQYVKAGDPRLKRACK